VGVKWWSDRAALVKNSWPVKTIPVADIPNPSVPTFHAQKRVAPGNW
jgi:hypothetical protein